MEDDCLQYDQALASHDVSRRQPVGDTANVVHLMRLITSSTLGSGCITTDRLGKIFMISALMMYLPRAFS